MQAMTDVDYTTIRLSPREEQVLQLISEGCTNKVIGDELRISQHTVKFWVFQLFLKFNADNRTALVRAWFDRRELKPCRPDAARVDRGDYVRAAGDTVCTCGFLYYDHDTVRGYRWLHRLCDGRLVKL